MILTANGNRHELQLDEISLLDFLKVKSVQPEMVAVERNMNIVPKSDYSTTILRDGDSIEIVKCVGGGC